MIKIGQVRKIDKGDNWQPFPDYNHKIVISYISDYGLCGVIYDTGLVLQSIPESFIEDRTNIIAEYQTWQEAVNSKEFKE